MHPRNWIIRKARAHDLDAMTKLLCQLFTIENDFVIDIMKHRHGLAALIADRDRSIIFVATVNDAVVGMCTAQINISTAEGGLTALIEDVIVDNEFRCRGIGTALLRTLQEWVMHHGCVRMQLLADIRNKKALRLYKRLSWSITNMICLTKKIQHHDYSSSVIKSETVPPGGNYHADQS